MLRFLRVRNLAVIEAVDVEFEPGFNVLTGETGAGKSILVEAVGLLLGGRATADLIRTGESQAAVEAIFESDGREILVRRDVSSQGRSRSFVDGTLCTTAALREVTAGLAEMHGQHEHQTLLDPATHLPVLDAYSALDEQVAIVNSLWQTLRTRRAHAERASMDARERTARLDLLSIQLGELDKAAPQPGEDDALRATREVLASADKVQRLCEDGYAALYESDAAVLTGLGGVWKRVAELATIEPRFAPYVDARDGIKGQLEDLAFFLRDYGEGVDASPARLQEVEDRLAVLERIKRKYGPTLDDVIARRTSLAAERDLLEAGAEHPQALERALDEATGAYLAAARDLSRRRKAAAGPFARRVEGLLTGLAMPSARFEVRFGPENAPEQWSDRGVDDAEFFLSPNPGEDVRPLARIASGGELSRVMLALKTLGRTAGESAAPGCGRTLIFDEVDAGIGGAVAAVVGERLHSLTDRFQVLCITHLPQIAVQGAAHYRIDKRVRNGRTTTTVERLGGDARVEEVGRMIGGAAVTDAVRATARELLRPAAMGRKAKGESESPARRRRP